MSKLPDSMKGELNNVKEKQTQLAPKETKETNEETKETESTEGIVLQEGTQNFGLHTTEELSYEEYKRRWDKRAINSNIQPYSFHIELFLGIINPEYNLEIQKAVADANLTGQQTRFVVPDSKVDFNWQVLDDRCEIINGAKVSNPFGIKALHGTLQEHYDALRVRNIRGSNPCIAINKIDGVARRNDNVKHIRALWLEDDVKRTRPRSATDIENPLPLPPSIIVESSAGKYHYYWVTYTEDLNLWSRIQKQVLTDQLGSDPGANGLNRAMRVPGFWHSKKRGFPTRIVYILGENNLPLKALPSKDFIEFAKNHEGVYEEFAFEPYLAGQVKRYDWEELVESFGRYLPAQSDSADYQISDFDPLEVMEQIHSSEDYHGALHSLCMHFANFRQDPEYITGLVQSIMCRVPENQRDPRWTVRFNDVGRSAMAAVTKKLEELALETQLPIEHKDEDRIKEVGIHDEDWPMPFPNITGIEPFDNLMEAFGSGTGHPIKSFNFAATFSFWSLILQNIPIMPVKAQRTANGCHILLAPSTEGKDLNTTSPLKALRQALHHNLTGKGDDHSVNIRNVIEGIQGNSGEITSLSAFHKWAGQKAQGKGGIWINTECTSQIGKMADENLNVSNLAEIPINIQDGEPIAPVNKVGAKDEVAKPIFEAISVLFATQPSSIKKYMTPALLYKGVIGRFDYYVSDRASIGLDEDVSYISKTALKPIQWDEEILTFINWSIKQCCQRTEGCVDGFKRRVATVFEDDDPDPFSKDPDFTLEDGPRRQKFIDWDLKWHRNEMYQMDAQFNTFADRVQMSTERWMTVFAAIEHLWKCYKNNKELPFLEPIVISDTAMNMACELGDYQYKVRFSRIWPLIGSGRGLDGQHKAVLDAISKADKSPQKWIRYITTTQQHVYSQVFKKEFYIPINSITRFLALDEGIATRDLFSILNTLQAMGLIEIKKEKIMDARLSSKPLKNLVRLTAEGRQ